MLSAFLQILGSAFLAHCADQVISSRRTDLLIERKVSEVRFQGPSGFDRSPPGIRPHRMGWWKSEPSEPREEYPPVVVPDDNVKVMLNFPNRSWDLGPARLKAGRGRITLPKALFQQISAAHPQQVGQLKYSLIAEPRKEYEVGNVFVGGPADERCERPVLLADWNGTLDHPDACMKPFLDQFLGQQNGTVMVVSSMGSSVPIETLRLQSLNSVMALPSLSSWGGDEKAGRVALHLWDTGACIIGFAGDSPDKEGAASEALGIPYFAVNQSDRRLYKMVTKDIEICRFNAPIEMPQVKGKGCPQGYDPEKEHEVECAYKSTSGQGKAEIFTWKKVPDYLLKDKEYPSYTCGVDFKPTGNERSTHICRFNKELEKAPVKGQCEDKYQIHKRTISDSVDVGSEPAFDISKYPARSIYARDWCDLQKKLTAQPWGAQP